MTIARLFAAATLAIASLGTATVADAQHYRGNDRGYERHHDDRDRGFRHDRGRHGYGRDWRGHRHDRCRIERHHHRSVRVCR